MYYLYAIKQEQKIYIGITKNLDCRLKQHQTGHGAIFTRGFKNADLVYHEAYAIRTDAEKRE